METKYPINNSPATNLFSDKISIKIYKTKGVNLDEKNNKLENLRFNIVIIIQRTKKLINFLSEFTNTSNMLFRN